MNWNKGDGIVKRHGIPVILRTALAALLILSAVSCAYFNTLYNANKLFDEAEEMRKRGGSQDRSVREKYGEVVKKCTQVVVNHPNSRWVDDAMFLMGMALVRQGELDKGIRKFIEITTNFPESNHVPPSIYWLAQAYYEKKDYNQALVYADKFLTDFPEHDLRYEVMSLAGDIHRELEEYEEALNYYAGITEGGPRDFANKAILKSAELFFANEQWEEAAANYEKLLRKGLSWQERYDISLALGMCYTKTGRCGEAKDIYQDLFDNTTTTNEKPPVLLGTASAYVCEDSLERAIEVYDDVVKKYPKSTFSAEAYYRMGVIFHERIDSLTAAQTAFSRVSTEDANSEFASVALQKSNSIKRLIELQESAGKEESLERVAEKKFLAAEIQLTHLNETELALGNYRAVIDSFPKTSVAPMAAYAVAWIYHKELDDSNKALDMYREVVTRYPLSPQARGAVIKIGSLGRPELMALMEAFMDSVRAEAAIVADSVRSDSTATVPGPDAQREVLPDSAVSDTAAAVLDITGPAQTTSGSMAIDSTVAGIDTTGLHERVRRETTYPLGGARTRPPVAPGDTLLSPSGGVTADTLLLQPPSGSTTARSGSKADTADTLPPKSPPDSTRARKESGDTGVKKEGS